MKHFIIIVVSLFVVCILAHESDDKKIEISPEALAKLMNKIDQLEEEIAGQKKINLPIGTIITSLLPLDEFSKQVQGTWILPKGQQVVQTSYGKLIAPSVPDFTGKFLRCIYPGREVGSPQNDALQGHAHAIGNVVSDAHGPNVKYPHGYQNGGYGLIVSKTLGVIDCDSFGKVRVADETRPANIAVYFYIRID